MPLRAATKARPRAVGGLWGVRYVGCLGCLWCLRRRGVATGVRGAVGGSWGLRGALGRRWPVRVWGTVSGMRGGAGGLQRPVGSRWSGGLRGCSVLGVGSGALDLRVPLRRRRR